jgi:hypothetical protein
VELVNDRVVTFSDPTPDECVNMGAIARCHKLGLVDLASRVEAAIKLQRAMQE